MAYAPDTAQRRRLMPAQRNGIPPAAAACDD